MPPRWSRVRREFEQHGCIFVQGRGSHVRIRRAGYAAATFTLHGLNPEIDLDHIRTACRQLGIDPAAFLTELGFGSR